MRKVYQQKENSFLEKISTWFGSFFLLPFVIYFTANIGSFFLIDTLNLLIHEGGHGVFKIFGKYIHALGGTLMQIIIPSMFVVFYWVKKIRFGVQAFLVWLGENLLNISVYVADARTQKLPLLGGKKVYHDWNYLLREINMLEYDKIFSEIFVFLGIASFVIAIIIPLLIRKEKVTYLNLNT